MSGIIAKRFQGMRVSIAGCLLLAFLSPDSFAALTDLADGPLVDAGTVIVKPNILFTLDDSGSMAWTHIPDSTHDYLAFVGYRNYLCNPLYYNPAVTYAPPKTSTNTDFTAASFSTARYNGYDSSSTAIDLATQFRAYDNTTGNVGWGDPAPEAQTAAYYFRFNGSGFPTNTQCSDSLTTYNTTNWTKVNVSAGTAAEKQNFANWYSFYRTRILMMKSAAGRAFSGLTDRYRVGFITIHPNGTGTLSDKYLAVSDFNQTQKDNWFAKFYGQSVGNATPLREALSRAGRYFAHKTDGINDGITDDPVQYSCQQNFTILTTDGYWNSGNPIDLDGNTLTANQDGTEPTPMWDGANAATAVTTVVQKKKYFLTRGPRGSAGRCSSGLSQLWYDLVNDSTTVITPPGTSNTTSTTILANQIEDSTCRVRTTTPADAIVQTFPSTSVSTSAGGSTQTLADVAEYYYKTDLRNSALGNCTGALGSGTDVCANNVFGPGTTTPEDDNLKTQHMTTFTLGLGISGTLHWDPNYKTEKSTDTLHDFADIRTGATTWPVPSADDPTTADDLWHTAVNGRGQAFSASNPNDVVLGLQKALAGIASRVGAAAAAAASSLNAVQGDNLIYTGRYTTSEWSGDVLARQIDVSTRTVGTTDLFSVKSLLDAKVSASCDNRTIYLFRSSATNQLADFSWNSFACDSSGAATGSARTGLNSTEQANFSSTQVANLSQYAFMTDGTGGTVNQRSAAAGANLVNFLRGQSAKRAFVVNDLNHLYRDRTSAMGDVIGGQPLYVRAPFASYADSGYTTFKTAQANRYPMIYVAANDGMLHAFYAGIVQKNADGTVQVDSSGNPILDSNAGKEAWAFIPTTVLPNLYKLADNNYANQHQYFVDGAPTAGDAYWGTTWKTILVGGFNKGGRGFYALDITDPANPKGLWEFKWSSTCYDSAIASTQFSDCHLGYSYGNPIISKLADGTWAVFVTSGHNNVNSPTQTGDGQGYLYVLRASDGMILYKIATGAGSATSPAGLAKIANWVDLPTQNNTTQRIYGADLLGNLWRFDVNDTIAPSGRDAFKLATLLDAGGNPQPVTTKPALSSIGSPPVPVVYVGTGRYLGASDLSLTQTQSVYAVQDTFPSATLTNLRGTLSQRTLVQTTDASGNLVRTVSCPTGGCTATTGWFADFPTSKERVNVDPKVQLGTLVVATGIPENDACAPGGKSWINFFDYATGGLVSGSTISGIYLPSGMVVGLNILEVNGKPTAIVTDNTGGNPQVDVPFASGTPSGRRVSWREISSD